MQTVYATARKKTLYIIGAASFGLLVTSALASGQRLSLIEADVLAIVYGVPAFLGPLFYAVTQLGSVGAIAGVVIAALVLKRRTLAALLLANSLMAYVGAALLKEIIARPRPAVLIPGIVARFDYADGFGFPSGHTAIATALALTLLPYVQPRYRWLLWLWIMVVGISRMYLGVHAPLDIVGGFCIGVIVVYITRLATYQYAGNKRPL